MKYAKKMKLVDIDDNTTHQPNNLYQTLQSDKNFVAPRTLSMLDGSMHDILNRRDLPDSEKWMLYNQTLQKFLNYMKSARSQHTLHKPSSPSTHHTPVQSEQRNHSLNLFDDRISDHSLSGIFPLRDSIDLISQPNVRNFFQQMRENVGNATDQGDGARDDGLASPGLGIVDSMSNHSQSPMDVESPSRNITRRRATKRNASLNITDHHPRKIAQINPRPLLQDYTNDFNWEPTQAK